MNRLSRVNKFIPLPPSGELSPEELAAVFVGARAWVQVVNIVNTPQAESYIEAGAGSTDKAEVK